MIFYLIDYLIVGSLLLLIARLGWSCFGQPTRRLVLARIIMLLLFASAVLLLVPNRPCVSIGVRGEGREASEEMQNAECRMQNETQGSIITSSDFNTNSGIRSSDMAATKPTPVVISLDSPREEKEPVSSQLETASVVFVPPVMSAMATEILSAETLPTMEIMEATEQAASEPVMLERAWFRFDPVALLLGAYFCGMLLVGAWLTYGAIHLRRLLRHSQNAPEEMKDLCELCVPSRSKANRARVRISPKIAAPIVSGALWPTILLPESFWKEKRKTRDQGLRFAMAHEWAHIINGDLWFLALYRLLTLVLFPHPLFWWLGRRMREEQELLADAHAAAMTLGQAEQNEMLPEERENRRRYALELVRWSRRAKAAPAVIHAASLTLAIGEEISRKDTKQNRHNTSFTRRIDMLLDENQLELNTPRRWKLLATLLLGTAMIAFSMITLQPRQIVVADETTTVGNEIKAGMERSAMTGSTAFTPNPLHETDDGNEAHRSDRTDEVAIDPLAVPEIDDALIDSEVQQDVTQGEDEKIDEVMDDDSKETTSPNRTTEHPDSPATINPTAHKPDGSDVINDSTVGNPFAPKMLKALHDEMVGGLNNRNIMGRFETWRGYINTTLHETRSSWRNSTEINGLARLSWYEELYRDPLTSAFKADQFSRYIHAGLSSGNSMQLAEVMYTIREKLDIPHQVNVTWVEQKREGRENIVVNPDTTGLTMTMSARQPDPHEMAIHELTYRISSAKSYYQKAVSTLTPAELNTLKTQMYDMLCAKETHGHTFSNTASAAMMLNLLLKVDRREMDYAAAPLVTLYHERTLEMLKQIDTNRLEAVTIDGQPMHQIVIPEGRILVGGRENNTYRLDDPGMMDVVCVVDLGGNDTYYEGTCTPDRPVLVIIDLDGDDQYIATKPGVQGGSLLGISMLIDCAGNDTYKAVDVAQGSSIGGIGILIDICGNDTYHAQRRAQGSAFAGVGMLIDLDGDDRYHAAMWSQGFGHSAGFGVLEDANGRDHYYLGGMYEDSYPEHPGYEGWGQGLGAGFRGVGGSACGGIGMLLDGGDGDDVYEFDYIAHGGGYWLGVGIARDFGGNDQRIAGTKTDYHGNPRPGVSSTPRRGVQPRWQRFSCGFGAHYALGFCFDDAGDDYYEGCTMGMGMGWDLAVGFLCDFGGNDKYVAHGAQTLGAGVNAGLGVLFDYSGDDVYQGGSQGHASPTVDPQFHNTAKSGGNFSFLVDYGGTDKYGTGAKDNSYNTRGSASGFLIDRPLETELH